MLTVGAPRWPISFGFGGKAYFSIRHGDLMNGGHRKMNADTAINTTVIRNFEPGENKSQTISIYTVRRVCRAQVPFDV